MEIVLAVLLLFGVITLGSVTTDKGDDDTQSTMAMPNSGSVPDSHQVPHSIHQRDPTRCHSDGSFIYRDLTVPYQDQVDQPVLQAGDCEGGRDCSYNPTAFPSSAVHGCTNAAIAGRNRAAMEVNCPDE